MYRFVIAAGKRCVTYGGPQDAEMAFGHGKFCVRHAMRRFVIAVGKPCITYGGP